MLCYEEKSSNENFQMYAAMNSEFKFMFNNLSMQYVNMLTLFFCWFKNEQHK